MAGVAALARELGFKVTGVDQAIYPPMSTQLQRLGIGFQQDYSAATSLPQNAYVLIGNALSRGNLAVEAVLNAKLPFSSGAQWLAENVLFRRQTVAVAGTHGKTTTSSLVAWLLECAGLHPGFMIGGIPENFGISARLGKGAPFVVEADEYDSAFFDKRSKCILYRPDIAILNNLEYDHADIFPNIEAIMQQFHYFVRTVPGNGRLIVHSEDNRLQEVLKKGCWTPVERFGFDPECDWSARMLRSDGSHFAVYRRGTYLGEVHWSVLGRHNVCNALGALAAVQAIGVDAATILPALASFRSVKRRLEIIGQTKGLTVYDDFAHHPTAISATLQGLRAKIGAERIIAVVEPRSQSMRMGAHAAEMISALQQADAIFLLIGPKVVWDVAPLKHALGDKVHTYATVDQLLDALLPQLQAGDHVVFMSNGGFDNAQQRFLAQLDV